jgi:hypothetical protein
MLIPLVLKGGGKFSLDHILAKRFKQGPSRRI